MFHDIRKLVKLRLVSITEVLLECSRTCLSTYCVRRLLYHNSRFDLLQWRLCDPKSWKYLLSGPLPEKLASL